MSTNETPVVLVADDDEDILELVAYRMELAGYEVMRAGNGEAAWSAATERTPDLAVLDVMMPKLTGLELTERLRQHEPTSGVPIILLTARTQEDDVTRGFAAGANDYLRKPFSPQELISRARSILNRTR